MGEVDELEQKLEESQSPEKTYLGVNWDVLLVVEEDDVVSGWSAVTQDRERTQFMAFSNHYMCSKSHTWRTVWPLCKYYKGRS